MMTSSADHRTRVDLHDSGSYPVVGSGEITPDRNSAADKQPANRVKRLTMGSRRPCQPLPGAVSHRIRRHRGGVRLTTAVGAARWLRSRCRRSRASRNAPVGSPGPVMHSLRADASRRLATGPVHPLVELFSRRGQDDLPVRGRDQAEVRVKVAATLQADQQPAARADIETPVGKRVRYLELLAEPVDEVPQFLQRHVLVASACPKPADMGDLTCPRGT
jgi:hypothetical protein